MNPTPREEAKEVIILGSLAIARLIWDMKHVIITIAVLKYLGTH